MVNIRDRIFPKFCVGCGKIGEVLCRDCKKQLRPHPEICPWCRKYSQHYRVCYMCKKEKFWLLEGVIIPFAYVSWIKKLIRNLKYYHQYTIAQFCAQRMAAAVLTVPDLADAIQKKKLLITYVPAHRRRVHRMKWYNQSKRLAQEFAVHLDISCISIVDKKIYTTSQAKLDRDHRWKNLQDAFVTKKDTVHIDNSYTILIVDDVTTTGSTLYHLARTIHTIYPNIKIWGSVVCRNMR